MRTIILLFDIPLRYSEWVKFDAAAKVPVPEELIATELYDLDGDPDETRNIANDEENADLMRKLSIQLWEKFNNKL